MNVQRDDVVAALRVDEVLEHAGIKGQWRGRWMRTRRCAETDHASDAFGINQNGHWHCHSCNKGGDLLALLALCEGLSIKDDFPAVLELAAGLAGVAASDPSDMFGIGPRRPERRERPEAAPLPPMPQRIALAKKRAAWVWDRLWDGRESGIAPAYLRQRGLSPDLVLSRETVKSTPLRIPGDLRLQIECKDPRTSDELRTLWWTMGARAANLAIAIPVRHVRDGQLVDVRLRRVEPREDQPKIIGMVGNVTVAPAERGKTRQLIGCYGNPHAIDADHVVVTEGLLDFLTSLQIWPDAQCIGAVEAGTMALVVGHVAQALAQRDNTSRLTIVEQSDPPRQLKDGSIVAGAADASINEDPNAATKVALRLLQSPSRVGWLFCDMSGAMLDGKPIKDLNDLVRAGVDVTKMHRWWNEPADTAE